jgi:hypothetical protein
MRADIVLEPASVSSAAPGADLESANNCVLLLSALEGDGLAERRRHPGDRRHIVLLTPAVQGAFAHVERALGARPKTWRMS